MVAQLRLALLLFVALVAACIPDEPLPPTGRVIVYALEADTPGAVTAWRADHRAALARLPALLAATGDTWMEVGPSSPLAVLTLRTFDSGARCPHGIGTYEPGTSVVFIDYACTHGDEQLRAVALHEMLHWYSDHSARQNVEHVCRRAGEAAGCWVGGYGLSVMNPSAPPEFDPEGEPVGPTVAEMNPLTLRWVASLRTR